VANIFRYRIRNGWSAFVEELRAFWATHKQTAVAALVLFMAYPSLTSQAFTMFQCMPNPVAGVRYLEVDLAVSCDSATHALASTLAWAVIGLLCGGLPALFAWWLYKHEDAVRAGTNTAFFRTFGFLYQGESLLEVGGGRWLAPIMARFLHR